jgi:hypothetical protein
MGNKIHRVLMSMYCTLMLSSAFLSAGDGYFMAGAVGGLQSIEASVKQKLFGLNDAGFQSDSNELPATVQHANGARVHLKASSNLRPIIAVLKTIPEGGTVKEDLARLLGMEVKPGEAKITMRQKGLSNGKTTRVVQIPADGRDCVMFILQRQDEVLIYVSASSGGLKAAGRNIPSRRVFEPISVTDAEAGFAEEISFWEAKLGVTTGINR